MNKNDFIKLVNLLIDKKLKEVLPKLVEKEIEKYMESGIEPNSDDFYGGMKDLIPNIKSKNPIIRDNSHKKENRTESKKWSNNETINKILNETANNFTPTKAHPNDAEYGGNYQQLLESEYEDIGSEFSFNTKNMADALPTQRTPMKASQNNLKNQILMDGANPTIANAMVKNYSGMLKKMDKAARLKRGSKLLPENITGENS